ncbi:MAG: hypothetical protein Fur0037_03610 [Planctomycetota bacterium]
MESPELEVVGLTCNVVGVFFLANSIRFREPRKAVEEALGIGAKTLERVRDTALNNMQVMIGFLFLTAGFLLRIMAAWESVTEQFTTLVCCAGIVFFAVAVYLIGAYSSRRAFKRLLREIFRTPNPNWSFTGNMAVTKEIGEIMGVPQDADATVETYVQKVRQKLGVQPTLKEKAAGQERSRRIRDISAIPGKQP